MFQAIAQNTDLKDRLRRIHAESMLLDSAANAKSSPDLVKVGMDFLFQWCLLLQTPTFRLLHSCILSCFFVPHTVSCISKSSSSFMLVTHMMLHCVVLRADVEQFS